MSEIIIFSASSVIMFYCLKYEEQEKSSKNGCLTSLQLPREF